MTIMQTRYSLTLGLTAILMSGCGDSSTQTTSSTPPSSSSSSAPPASPATEQPAAKPSAPVAGEPQATTAPQATTEPQAVPVPQQDGPAPDSQATASSSAPSAELQLAQNSGCLACHSVEKKLVGPAWRDVAARYRDDSGAQARLVVKVSEGGKGNWTDVTGGVGMPPYGTRVKAEDIAQLVQFILSLK